MSDSSPIAQQRQALDYFDAHADDWQRKAVESESYNLIAARNHAVLRVLEAMPNASRLLDVGCGTGQLVIDAARKGSYAVGVDFAAEMIAQCRANLAGAGVEASFITASFFDLPDPDELYDLVSAQGFIEYISPSQMEEFFGRCARILKRGGHLVVGSRNRLFNLLSLNQYTKIELDLGTIPQLVTEAVALQMSESQTAAFAAISDLPLADVHPEQHPGTGIGVDVRYQYSPAELVSKLRKHGFQPATIFPVHYHAVPLSLARRRPEIHSRLAMFMGDIAPDDVAAVPHCSTFVLDVRLEK